MDTFAPNVTVGESITFYCTVSLPEGTTLFPRVVVKMPYLFGTLSLVSARLLPVPSNMVVSSFLVALSDANGDLLLDTATASFASIVNHPNNVRDSNDTVVLEFVALVELQGNGDGTELTAISSFTHNSFTSPIAEAPQSQVVRVVQPVLYVSLVLNVTTGDAGDGVLGSVVIGHTSASSAVAYDVNLTALLAPHFRLLPAITISDPTAVPSCSSAPEWNGLMHLPKLLLGSTVTLTFSSYLDISVLASTMITSKLDLEYLSSPSHARNSYLDFPCLVLTFSFLLSPFLPLYFDLVKIHGDFSQCNHPSYPSFAPLSHKYVQPRDPWNRCDSWRVRYFPR